MLPECNTLHSNSTRFEAKNRHTFQLWGNIWGYNSRFTILDVAILHEWNEFTLQSIWNNEMLQYGILKWSSGYCFSPQEVNLGSTFLANFSKTAEQKQTPLVPFLAQLETRVILKYVPNRCIIKEVIAKIRYRTKWPQSRDTAHSELKLTFWTT